MTMVKTPPVKQDAELRAFVSHEGKHLRVASVTVHNADIYLTHPLPGGRPDMKMSWHRSGHSHLRVGQQDLYEHGRPPTQPVWVTSKARELWGASVSLTGPLAVWGYEPKAESRRRRNLSVELVGPLDDQHAPILSFQMWAVEHGRGDLIDIVLRAFESETIRVLVHEVVDWTSPQIVACFWTLTELGYERLPGPDKDASGPQG